jgi:hypothetical protein
MTTELIGDPQNAAKEMLEAGAKVLQKRISEFRCRARDADRLNKMLTAEADRMDEQLRAVNNSIYLAE